MDDATARRLWTLFEAVHAVVYFSPEPKEALAAAGYRGFWMSYFAARLAPIGEVEAEVAQAACFGFAPDRVHGALPDAWRYAGAEAALAARLDGCSAALTRLLGPGHDRHIVNEAAELAWRAADGATTHARLLAAGNQALARPSGALATLWQACTTLREHRGDGHNIVLVAEHVDPVAAHVIKMAARESNPETLSASRHYPDAVWAAAHATLHERGWLDDSGLTTKGHAAHERIERQTDALAAQPWTALGADDTASFETMLQQLAPAAAGDIPYPNPIGVPPVHSAMR